MKSEEVLVLSVSKVMVVLQFLEHSLHIILERNVVKQGLYIAEGHHDLGTLIISLLICGTTPLGLGIHVMICPSSY